MKQKIGIIIVVLLILFGAIYIFSNRKAAAPETTDEQQTRDETINDNPSPITPVSANSLVVSAQVAGSSVTIDQIILTDPGFIVIHELSSSGQAGKIIGTSNLLTAGTKQDLEISAPLKAGMTYVAMLHKDNGDKKFNAATDLAVTDSAGQPLMKTFIVAK